MAVEKYLARNVKFEVEDAVTPGTWIEIKGLTQFSFSPEKTDADTTDFNSNGVAEHLVAQRNFSVSLEGRHLLDTTTGDGDPGQTRVEEIAAAIGTGSIGNFRMTSPGGKTKTFKASANVTKGGSTNDPTSWQAALTVSGAITEGTAT